MLKAINVTKSYQDKVALKNVSFEVKKGEIFCLLGHNGAGKTTTINIFLGFIKKDGGQAFVGENEVGHGNTNALMAYIPETVELYGNLSGVENLDFFSRLAGFNYSIEELEAYLSKTNLQPDAHHKKIILLFKGNATKSRDCNCISKKCRSDFYG